jgi:AraC-like DNA-binding protein
VLNSGTIVSRDLVGPKKGRHKMVINNQFQYIHAVRDDRKLSSNAKLVALIIASHFNWMDDNPAFPSLETLAEECGMSVSSVKRGKAELIENNWLTQERRYNNSNLYTPNIPTGHIEPIKRGIAHIEPSDSSNRPVQMGHIEQLKDNIKDNIKDKNNGFAVQESEEAGLDNNIININKYLNPNLSLDVIKEEVNDKDMYFNIIKERKVRGIL